MSTSEMKILKKNTFCQTLIWCQFLSTSTVKCVGFCVWVVKMFLFEGMMPPPWIWISVHCHWDLVQPSTEQMRIYDKWKLKSKLFLNISSADAESQPSRKSNRDTSTRHFSAAIPRREILKIIYCHKNISPPPPLQPLWLWQSAQLRPDSIYTFHQLL